MHCYHQASQTFNGKSTCFFFLFGILFIHHFSPSPSPFRFPVFFQPTWVVTQSKMRNWERNSAAATDRRVGGCVCVCVSVAWCTPLPSSSYSITAHNCVAGHSAASHNIYKGAHLCKDVQTHTLSAPPLSSPT